MEKQYNISGMTCGGCVSKVKKILEAIPEVKSAQVQLEAPQGILFLQKEVSMELLNGKLSSAGNYTIEEIHSTLVNETEIPQKSITTYKPLVLIVSFIAGVSFLVQYPFENFSGMLWMRYFMAGFFFVFAFF